MSRIVGLLLEGIPDTHTLLVENMLEAASSGEGWPSNYQASGKVLFGWTGWDAANTAEADGIIVTMDGIIYNRLELGIDGSDAQVMVSLYLKYGFEGALQRLNGDLAVALYDPAEETLWLGRDRIGIKPLYYTAQPGLFAFASRPRSLLSLPGVSRNVNRQFTAIFAGSHYRYFDNDPHASPYQDVAQLPAAHYLRFKDGHIHKGVYWTLEEMPDHEGTESELAERYRDLLMDAVSVRLERAENPAFTLSGGMDSSSVLGSAVKYSGRKQHAFSTVYEDKTYDESDEIRSMLDRTVEQWHPIAVGNPDVFSLVEKMIAGHDEPVATATWLAHYILCEAASEQGFGGLFGGLGGDELNAGEYEYFILHFADLRRAGQEEQLKHEVEQWIRYHDHPIFRKSFAAMEDGLSRLVDISEPGRCLPDRTRLERYAAVVNPEYFDLRHFEPLMDHTFRSYLKNRTYQDMFRETIPCCLRAEDRQTMAFNLDNFVPFFDYRLAEFMFGIPGRMKIRDGITKRLLREATRDILPEETRTRVKKTGWNAPAHVWFSGKGMQPVRDLVGSQSFRERGIYKIAEVNRIIDEHEQIVLQDKTVDNHMMFLWQLVNLELWLQSIS